jgi:hypothetical protein
MNHTQFPVTVSAPHPSVVFNLGKPLTGFSYKVTENPDGSLTIESVAIQAPAESVPAPVRNLPVTATARPQVARPVKKPKDVVKAPVPPFVNQPHQQFGLTQTDADDTQDLISVNPTSIDISDDGDVTIYKGNDSYYVHFAEAAEEMNFIEQLGGEQGVANYFRDNVGQYTIKLKLNDEETYDFVSIYSY